MRNLFKQFKKGSREVRLTIEEKSVMRQALAQFTRENPIMRTSQTRKTHAISSPYSFMRKTRSYKIVSATVIGGLLIGGTVSFAAEGVLPGNVLYPVKTQVNERVRGLATVTPQAKAEWDIALVERRLSEMKEVGSLESVSSETKEFARGNVKKYTERVQKRIAEFDDNDDDERALEVAENLAHVLQTHERELLEGMSEGDDDDSDDDEDEADAVETNETKQDNKESPRSNKVIKRVRTTAPTNINASNTLATSTSLVNMKYNSTSTVREEGKHDDTEDTRHKKNDTESLEKTINDIREIRENLEKRNREKKAEYERRKESREEEEKENDEHKTYFSDPSSEQER